MNHLHQSPSIADSHFKAPLSPASSSQPSVLKLKLVFRAWPCSGRISTDPGDGAASTMKGTDLRLSHPRPIDTTGYHGGVLSG